MVFIIWSILFVIAVVDAREHRIPNKLVVTLFAACAIYQWLSTWSITSLMYELSAGLFLFALGLAVFFLRAMSPGDVKLLAGIGVYLGWEGMSQGIFWMAVSSMVVGLMYLSLPRVLQPDGSFENTIYLPRPGKQNIVPGKQLSGSKGERLQMPFAPIVVIGLALHSYFG
ncbi:Type IV leader peptidase family protein [Vibrio aerogenes CECT 7868]|uniref:Type IV leader peptidase family protein n=1 Tax=Vibrio aerogenes CECT 7868 TaxID=1216006 RepID=A0A1M5ZGI2_9VIBR|nr:prepilin peptidase [Vibrio aerogenes]SHI23320.1 Type IV leader peptidase family protein [Vibrio aerogenes CECT 7868]